MLTRHTLVRSVAGCGLLASAVTAVFAVGAQSPESLVPSTGLPVPARSTRGTSTTDVPPVGLPLTGKVTDSAGRALANAIVVLSPLGRQAVTDASGTFTFDDLRAGRYQIHVMLVGYAPIERIVIVPESGSVAPLAFSLQRSAVDLESVHVTASPTASNAHDVAQSTVQLSGQSLMRNLGASVAQTLQEQPGLTMRYNGPSANMPVIRGLTGDRVLVLQNGDRAGDLASAAPDHAITIDPLAAQRIEVVRGPASLLYGSSAIGGVVNVIAEDIPKTIPSRITGMLATQGESVNPGGAGSGMVTVPLSGIAALTVRGSYRGVDNTRQGGGETLLNSFSHNGGGAVGLGFVGERATGGVSYEGTKFSYGLPATADDDEFGARIRGQRQQVTGRSDITMDNGLFTNMSLTGTAQWYKHDEIENTGDIGTSFNLKTQTANLIARTLFGSVSGAVGVSGLFKQYAATGEEALTPAANTKSGGVFLFQDIPLMATADRSPHVQVGVRYDVYDIQSKEGDPKFGAARSLRFNSASGSAGLVVPLSEGVSLNGNISRAFRAPTVEELFSNAFHAAAGTYDVGNPDLKAETNNGAEAVLRVSRPRLNAQLSGYYNRITNYITVNIVGDTVAGEEDDDEGGAVPLNRYGQSDATLKGMEGMIEGEVVPHLVLGGMADVVRGTLKSGEPLPFMPAARIGTTVRYDNSVWNVGADYRHGFKQTRVPVAAATNDPSAIATDAYNLVNLSAGYTFTSGGLINTLTFRIDNVFDEEYKDATSRIKGFAFNPGRNVSLVYRVLF